MRESGQIFPTPIELTRLDARVRPGEKSQVRIDAGTAEDVLVIPVTAVVRGRVRVQPDSGESQWRDVVLGRTDGEMVEVLDGLKEGEQIVSKPVSR
jgi:multidrug efflux pump subunit AcrA (membrane-fusion protein)